MSGRTVKVAIQQVPLEEGDIPAFTTTAEQLMASEYRTQVMRRLSTRQQMFFILLEMGYKEQEIVHNFNTTSQALWSIRHRIRRICKEITELGYN